MKNQEKPYYTIRQSEKVFTFLYWSKKTIYKTYKFDDFKNAFRFALDEQIKIITVHISKTIKTTRRPFNYLYTLEEFKRLCKINPLHYLGLRNHNKINIELYYFYLINSNQLTKLKKY